MSHSIEAALSGLDLTGVEYSTMNVRGTDLAAGGGESLT